MNIDNTFTAEGGCDCRAIRYRLTSRPLFVHCCHCRWCQRETGASFALNAMIEADRVELLSGEPQSVHTPSNSGKGQKIVRCPKCLLAVWSNYAGAGDAIRFVRVGTLDNPDCLPPDIHIFTASKQPWVVLPPQIPARFPNITIAISIGRPRAWRACAFCAANRTYCQRFCLDKFCLGRTHGRGIVGHDDAVAAAFQNRRRDSRNLCSFAFVCQPPAQKI